MPGVCRYRVSCDLGVRGSILSFERLLEPDNTELPDCVCGVAMGVSGAEPSPNQIDAVIRIYKCEACGHQMLLTVWGDEITT
jgi:hypothetical protein